MISPENYIPTLQRNEPLSSPINARVIIDRSSEFELPFRIEDLPRMALHDLPQKEGGLGRRSLSERRALTIAPTFFKSVEDGIRQPKVYSDILIKGGGADVPVIVGLKEGVIGQPEAAKSSTFISNVVEVDGVPNVLRYHVGPIKGLTSHLGVHVIDSSLSDHYMSQYLASKGLRTRELIAAWALPDDQIISTERGLITTKEFKELTGINPGLEAWAMRCKFRIADISRLIYEVEEMPKFKDPDFDKFYKLTFTKTPIKLTPDEDGPAHKFNEKRYDSQQLDIIRSNLISLADQIRVRAVHDDDPRFSGLSENHKVVSNLEEAKAFYEDYVGVFSEILGEQFAIMDLSDVVSGMFNPQNITLDAAIVDHDVSMKGGKVMNSEGVLENVDPDRLKHFSFDQENYDANFAKQLTNGFKMMLTLLKDLNRVGMMDLSDEEITSTLKHFIDSFFTKMEANPERRAKRLIDVREEMEDIQKETYVEPADPSLYSEDSPPIEHIKDPFYNDWPETYIKILEQVLAEQK